MVSIILKVRIKMKRGKTNEAEEEEMSWAAPPLKAWGLGDKQLSRGWGEWILSSNLCLHVDSDEAILWGEVICEVITLNEYGVVRFSFFFFSLETQLKAITSTASSITSRNKHCNHVLHPGTNFLGTKRKSEEDTSSFLNKTTASI